MRVAKRYEEDRGTQLERSASWSAIQLGEICDVQLGKMLSPKSKTGTRPIPYLRNENVQWNRFDLEDVPWMDFSEAEETKFRLQPGDLLVCEGGEPGRAAVWDGQIERCCYQKALHRIRPRKDLLRQKFLMYYLWTAALERNFTGSHGKTTIAHLPRERLIRLEIPLPSLREQERIASDLTAALATVDTARRAAQDRRAAAEALSAAYLRQVFDGPHSQKWPTRRLGDVLVPHKEIIHPGDRTDGTAIFVGLEHVESTSGRRLGSLEIDLARMTGRKPTFHKGQIVYGYLRPYLNKVWIAEFDGCSSVDQFAYDVRSDLADTRFVAWFMRSATYLHRSAVVTTTGQLPRIGTEEIAAVEIGLPPLSEQQRIARQIDHYVLSVVADLTNEVRNELAAIESLPAALLRRAFSN